MNYKTFTVSLLALYLTSATASAVIVNVPADFATIQAAINAAAISGDEIIVAPGTYPEVINFLGKAINLHSASGNPADTIIDGTGLNESVVLCITGEGPGTILEGFTLTGGTGHDNGLGDFRGGGVHNDNSSPTITNCTFSGNATNSYGGGMYNSISNPTITNCTFSGNAANTLGGGMYNSISSPTITNCTFSGNTATSGGGGMLNQSNSSPTIINCTFSGNTATSNGGGMFNGGSSSPTITNCIFQANLPNTQIYNSSGTPIVSFSNVQGGLGTGSIDFGGNININPGFVDADGSDNIPGTPDDDLHLLPGSPCIDAGDNLTPGLIGIFTDLEGNPRFFDDPGVADTGLGVAPLVDMGVYERQIPSGSTPCAGDIAPPGGNGTVNIDDLVAVLNAFGPCP